MVLAFLFSWVPFGWMYLLPLLDIQQRGNTNTTDVLPLFAVKLGCAIINPLVYSFTNLQVLLYDYSNALIFWINRKILLLGIEYLFNILFLSFMVIRVTVHPMSASITTKRFSNQRRSRKGTVSRKVFHVLMICTTKSN